MFILIAAFAQLLLFLVLVLVPYNTLGEIEIVWLCNTAADIVYSCWILVSFVFSSLVIMYIESSCRHPQMVLHLTADPACSNYGLSESDPVPEYKEPSWKRGILNAIKLAART